MTQQTEPMTPDPKVSEERRGFLQVAGKAAVAAPAAALLLAATAAKARPLSGPT